MSDVEIRQDIEQIRAMLLTPGWRDHAALAIAKKMDQAKNNLAVTESERTGEYTKWSTDRIGGFIIGLGWTLATFVALVQQYDKARMLALAEAQAAAEADTPHGDPYSTTATDLEASSSESS